MHTLLRTPFSPPLLLQPLLWQPETPHNIGELQRQTGALYTLMHDHSQSPSSPTVQAVRQLVKGCELAMQSATLLKAENKTLRAANEKVKKKRAKKRSYIGRGEILTPAEALGSCAPEAGVEIVPVEPIVAPRAQRGPRLCSICRSPSHTARSCPEC